MKGRYWIALVVASFAFLAGGFFFFLGSLCSLISEKPKKGDVAVVEVTGMIYESQPVLDQLKDLKKEKSVKAVILRIDSPGGTVGASQEIFEAVKDLNDSKPVVASMGTVAASGGYYIAAPARKIVANAGTITGSIGVRMEILNIQELLKWAKVDPVTLKSGAMKDVGSPTRPMTAEERAYIEGILKKLHEQFKASVALSRGLTKGEMDAIADGRILTGLEAKEKKLVDEIGGMNLATKIAAELGGVKGEPEVFYPPKGKERFWESLVEGTVSRASERVLSAFLTPLRLTF